MREEAGAPPSGQPASHPHTLELGCGRSRPEEHVSTKAHSQGSITQQADVPQLSVSWCHWSSPGWRGDPDGHGDKGLLACMEQGDGERSPECPQAWFSALTSKSSGQWAQQPQTQGH